MSAVGSSIWIERSLQGAGGDGELHLKVTCSIQQRGRLDRDLEEVAQNIKSLAGCYISNANMRVSVDVGHDVVIKNIAYPPNKNQSYYHLVRSIPQGRVTYEQIERALLTMSK